MLNFKKLSKTETTQFKIWVYNQYHKKKKSFKELSEITGLPSSKLNGYYLHIKELKTEGDFCWLDGLSSRAITQLKKLPYTNFESFSHDVLTGKLYLEDLPHVGKKLANEIKQWCKTAPYINQGKDRRFTDRRK